MERDLFAAMCVKFSLQPGLTKRNPGFQCAALIRATIFLSLNSSHRPILYREALTPHLKISCQHSETASQNPLPNNLL
jgi:hypothetical protein